MAGSNGQIDTAIEVVTPENIAFQYRAAGPFRRLPAYLIDLVLRVAFVLLVGLATVMILGPVGLEGQAVFLVLVLWFLLTWFYGGVFEAYWNGQTPGKRLFRIRVLSVDGRPINGAQAVLRNLLRVLDMQPMFLFPLGSGEGHYFPVVLYQVGLVSAILSRRFQRLGDLACGTMVVVEEPQWFYGVVRIADPGAIQLAQQIPAGFQASRTLARALAAYVQRRGNFSIARRTEIARHVGVPLRDQFRLPPETDLDLLLCALYYRTFITDRGEGANGQAQAVPASPFQIPETARIASAG